MSEHKRTVERMERAFRYYEVWRRASSDWMNMLSETRKIIYSTCSYSLPTETHCAQQIARCDKKRNLCRAYLLNRMEYMTDTSTQSKSDV